MSLQIVEIDTGNNPSIVYINQGPQGDVGPAGPPTIVDQTVIDGSANAVSGNAVFDALALKANLASPTFTGIVTAPRIDGKCAGLELFCKAGQSINAGQVVYVTGAAGTNVIIGLAQANTELTSSRTIGVCESTLALNATGYVITEGLMTVSISSATALVGDPIWLSGTTAGGMLFGAANKPVFPYHVVYLGVVTRKTGNTIVEIYVKVQNGFELDELSDVLITDPLANQALVRNSDKWINRALVSNDISDSSTGGNGAADAGKLVEFNSTGGVAVSTLNKVTITQPATSATLTIADGAIINAQGEITISSAGAYIITGTTGIPAPPPPTGGIITSSTGYISTTAGGSFSTGTGNLTGPNASGTVALINPSSGVQTFSGAQSFTGQLQLTGQAATDAFSAMTLGLVRAREHITYHGTELAGISVFNGGVFTGQNPGNYHQRGVLLRDAQTDSISVIVPRGWGSNIRLKIISGRSGGTAGLTGFVLRQRSRYINTALGHSTSQFSETSDSNVTRNFSGSSNAEFYIFEVDVSVRAYSENESRHIQIARLGSDAADTLDTSLIIFQIDLTQVP